MDTWSRFCRCYALPTKDKKSVIMALALFCKEFAAHGHLPRRMLADRGSDRKHRYVIMCTFNIDSSTVIDSLERALGLQQMIID